LLRMPNNDLYLAVLPMVHHGIKQVQGLKPESFQSLYAALKRRSTTVKRMAEAPKHCDEPCRR
jgi:hypothetical protein